MRESPVQQRVRLAIAQAGGLPQRNNVGVADMNGTPVRFGLMNSSVQENRQFKSSDLISPIPVQIQPHHVGRTMGVLSVFEVKHSDWKYRPKDAHSAAQWRYIQLMHSVGCIGGFVTDPAQVAWYLDEFLTRRA